jgi:hypothetical protein
LVDEEWRQCAADYNTLTAPEREAYWQELTEDQRNHLSAVLDVLARDAARTAVPQAATSLDCSACKTKQTMKAATVPRFGGFIRFLGVIIVIPSLLGVALAVLFFISTSMVASVQLTKTTSEAANAGTVLGAGIGYGISVFIGASSLVGGLIGWLLLTSRKVYKCVRCNFILERA